MHFLFKLRNKTKKSLNFYMTSSTNPQSRSINLKKYVYPVPVPVQKNADWYEFSAHCLLKSQILHKGCPRGRGKSVFRATLRSFWWMRGVILFNKFSKLELSHILVLCVWGGGGRG
jgi:hypothetical protein